MQSPFILSDELNAITLTSDVTRRRMEKLGKFPRRVRIGNRKTAHIRADVQEWARNPDAWAKANAAREAAQ
jgi:predicted DNA-binding transcriptional regulator AlpA